MKTFKDFKSLYEYRNELPDTGWIYIKEEDFQDLDKATFFVMEKNEITPDDYIETEDDIIPTLLYKIDRTITGLVENHIFLSIYDNMEQIKKDFSIEEKIEALYHYVEEDTFLY